MYMQAGFAGALLAIPAVQGNLHQLAQAAGKLYFGSATDNPELSDPAYAALLSDKNEFGQITPGNTQKWQYTEPTQNTYSYAQGDVIADFAASNGQILRCHTLIWHQQLPSWLSTATWTNRTLTAAVQAHIASEVGHYKGKCYAWDVVNEALDDDGSYRASVFYNTMGTSYLPVAFAAAAAADPAAKLYYNDYNIEYPGAKSAAAATIVKLIQAAGAKIDGIGLQGHFIVGGTPSAPALAAQLNTYAGLGLDVAYTEVDVRFPSLPPTPAGLAQQAADYGAVVAACLAVARCVGLSVWDFGDAYSWIPATFPGQGDACLFWPNLTAKPAYDHVQRLLAAAGAGPATTTALSTGTGTTTTATSRSAASSGTAAPHWWQCGGPGWAGPKTCEAPYTCQVVNYYYSQCL